MQLAVIVWQAARFVIVNCRNAGDPASCWRAKKMGGPVAAHSCDGLETPDQDAGGASLGAGAALLASGGTIAVQDESGSNFWIDSTTVAVSSPRSFWKTTPSWLTMKVMTPLAP